VLMTMIYRKHFDAENPGRMDALSGTTQYTNGSSRNIKKSSMC